MKKFLFFIAVAFSVMSCLDGGAFSQSYTADVTFEFSHHGRLPGWQSASAVQG